MVPLVAVQRMAFGNWKLVSAMAALNAFVCEQLLAEARQHLPPSAARALSASATPLAEAAAARELQAGRAALASVREEAAAVGQQLLPLRSPAELAILLQVELLYPLGTPKRSYKVLVELRARGVVVPSQSELDLLLSRLHASDEWKRALRSLKMPAEQRCVFVPPVTECVVCGSTDLVHARNGRSNQRDVYSCRGTLNGELCGLQCKSEDCGAVHYMSFASGGKKLLPIQRGCSDNGAGRLCVFRGVHRCSPVFRGRLELTPHDGSQTRDHTCDLRRAQRHSRRGAREGHECLVLGELGRRRTHRVVAMGETWREE